MPVITFEDAHLIEGLKRHYKQGEAFSPADVELLCIRNPEHFEQAHLKTEGTKARFGFRIQLGRRLSQFAQTHHNILRLVKRVNNTPVYILLEDAFKDEVEGKVPRTSVMAKARDEKALHNRIRNLEETLESRMLRLEHDILSVHNNITTLVQEVAKLNLAMGTAQPPIGSLSTTEGDRLQTRRLGDPQFADRFREFGLEVDDEA